MKHAASRELYAYWQEKRGTRPAPERTEIEPGAIRGVLADAFVLALDRGASHPIRLAGTRMCALFGREIKGESFLDLWASTNRPTMEGLLSILSDECTGTVAGASGRNENGELGRARTVAAPAQHSPADIRARHRRAGTAQYFVVAGDKPHRAADHWRPAPHRRGARKAADATLHSAARPAWLRGL